MEQKKLSLEQCLQSYRCISAGKDQSWKQNYVNEKFSDDSLWNCTEDEIQRFRERVDFLVTITQSRTHNSGETRSCFNLLNATKDPRISNIKKERRFVVYSSSTGERPKNDRGYLLWNGFQIIDIDIKDREKAQILKQHLFNDLKKFNWFIGVLFSSSGKGLHVYTKIQIPENDNQDLRKKKILFFTNFRHKYSFVYLSCLKALDQLQIDEETLKKWLDLAMARPSQGAFIPYDPDALFSSQFFEDFIYVCFDNIEDMGNPSIDWVSHPSLKQIFKRWEWFDDGSTDHTDEDNVKILPGGDITSAPLIDPNTEIRRYHYKHNERWRLANTLVGLYGIETGNKFLRLICTNDTTDGELEADCKTAANNNKALDPWAIARLNKYHGFKIKVNIKTKDEVTDLTSTLDEIGNPLMLIEAKNKIELHITKKQYLGDITEDILKNCGHITLIEAGAGVGKTEMVKKIARSGKKIMMVMPFTSTIKSKIEGDSEWYYVYGNRRIDLNKPQSVALTIDKFSHINLLELKNANFDYIFIDESHLLFQSSYRDVMPKVIDMIANSESPIIMMSGTPVGEIVFFPNLTHIKITKEDVRIKEFNVIYTEDDDNMFLDMCRSMAKDICDGKRILFPTNKGSLYKEQVQAAVQYFCENEFHCRYAEEGNQITVNYYKKSNDGEDFMDAINVRKTIGKTDILLCSNYLSVGVDIEDKYAFSIYINDYWMPQEIEQFANRLRANDLYINMCISRKDPDGNLKPIFTYKNINLKLNDEELRGCHAILRMCNAMIERSPVEYKYNSLISSIINNNKFIEYDNIENKYYLNETAYKTTMFENKYREYIEQPPVIIRGMQNYGYKYHAINRYKFELAEGIKIEDICDSKKRAREALRLKNTEDIYDLINLITKDKLEIYRDAMRGRYEIKKYNSWKIDENLKIIYVKNIEVFEHVIPIFLSLSKMFEIDDIRDIFEYCKRKEYYNFSAIKRIRTLANITFNDKKNRLDVPIKQFMEEVDYFINNHVDKICTKGAIEKFINQFAIKYATQESTDVIKIGLSTIAMQTLVDSLREVFKCLVDVSRPRKDGTVRMIKCELLWQEKKEDNLYDTIEGTTKDFLLGDILNTQKNENQVGGIESYDESILVPIDGGTIETNII